MPAYTLRCPSHGDYTHEQSIEDWPLPKTHEGCGQPVDQVIANTNLFFTYGRDTFHGPTISEQRDDMLQKCKEDGVVAEPVGQRWV